MQNVQHFFTLAERGRDVIAGKAVSLGEPRQTYLSVTQSGSLGLLLTVSEAEQFIEHLKRFVEQHQATARCKNCGARCCE